MGRARGDGVALEQMTLPRRHVGLDLCRTSLLKGHAAFVSVPAQTEWAMASGPAEFRPFEGLSGSGLMREGLHDAGGGLWQPMPRKGADGGRQLLAHHDRAYSCLGAAQRYAAILVLGIQTHRENIRTTESTQYPSCIRLTSAHFGLPC
jgi:hypothetical protein